MSEILIGQTLDPQGPVSTLPGTTEEKAKQIPVPKTYHLLCLLQEAEEAYATACAVRANWLRLEALK